MNPDDWPTNFKANLLEVSNRIQKLDLYCGVTVTTQLEKAMRMI
jgi:hypothetical protein